MAFRSKLVDQQCRAIGAGSKKAGLPERFLSRVPDKHVHASRAQVIDAHHKGDAQVIVVSDDRQPRAAAPIEIATTMTGCRKRIRPSPRYAAREVHGDGRQEPRSPRGRPRSPSIAPARDSQAIRERPRANPPSTHPRGLDSPPMIAPENPFSAIERPTYSEADAIGAMRKPLRPASAELRKNAPTMTAVTLIPIRLATRWSCATARIALPIMVLLHHPVEAAITTIATTNIRISCGLIPTPAIRMTSSPTGEGTTIWDGPQIGESETRKNDAEADRAHHPGHARLAGEWLHRQDSRAHADQPNHDHGHNSGKQLLPARQRHVPQAAH